MVILSGHNSGATPNSHRKNRRRERPGSRTRRTINRNRDVNFPCYLDEYEVGISEAHDPDFYLPSDRHNVSPILRQNFDQSWQRWKAREAEEAALLEVEKLQMLELEQIKLFGGDIGDDDLYRMGILYHDDKSARIQEDLKSVETESPVERIAPVFVLRPTRRSRNIRRRQPQLFPSHSHLSTKPESQQPIAQTIQHRRKFSASFMADLPQSLPPHSALESASHSNFLSPAILDDALGDWTFIQPSTRPDTPASEPETWILLSDDS